MSAPAQPAPATLIRVPAGTTAGAAVREAGLPGRGDAGAIVVVADAAGKLRDLSWTPDTDVEVRPVAADTEEGRSVIRHSAAHVLAQAVQEMFPDAKLGIGPPITDGFYYDFAVAEPFTPENLAALEKKMAKIIKDGQLFDRRVYASQEQALAELADEPFKLELVEDKSVGTESMAEIMEVGGDELTAYDNLNPRTRVYGTAWESQEALDHHLELIEEAQRRDHRKLGVELDLYSFPDELGSGLPVFHPRGGILRKELEDYSRRKHVEGGYQFVNTPHITKEQLYITSGHLEWYADGMDRTTTSSR